MGILLLGGGQNALAVCIFGSPSDATFVLPATITVSQAAAVGDVLYRSPILPTQSNGQAAGTCDANGGYSVTGYLAAVQAVAGMTRVYQTNIPGIGVKVSEVTNSRHDVYGPGHDITLEANVWQRQWTLPPHYKPFVWASFQVEFIFTGPVSPGVLSLPSFLAGTYSSDSPTALVNQALIPPVRLLTIGTTQVLLRGCTVDNNAIAVRLPTISSSSLNSVGATAGATHFTIALTCYSSTRVAYQFEGTSSPDTTASLGILANRANTGDATGVGVQILASQGGLTAPVTLNSTLFTSFVTTTSHNQPVSIPFVARYYKTSATMTTGAVWARATFTMDYQ